VGPCPPAGVGRTAVVGEAGYVEVGIERAAGAGCIFEEIFRRQGLVSASKRIVYLAHRMSDLMLDDRGEVDRIRGWRAASEIVRARPTAAEIDRVTGEAVNRVGVLRDTGQRLVFGVGDDESRGAAHCPPARVRICGGEVR